MAGFDGTRPIFLQLAEMLEEGIISGAFPEEGQIPSITEYSAALKINPATALKGINLLVDEGLVYKKRASACSSRRERARSCFAKSARAFIRSAFCRSRGRPKRWASRKTSCRL